MARRSMCTYSLELAASRAPTASSRNSVAYGSNCRRPSRGCWGGTGSEQRRGLCWQAGEVEAGDVGEVHRRGLPQTLRQIEALLGPARRRRGSAASRSGRLPRRKCKSLPNLEGEFGIQDDKGNDAQSSQARDELNLSLIGRTWPEYSPQWPFRSPRAPSRRSASISARAARRGGRGGSKYRTR